MYHSTEELIMKEVKELRLTGERALYNSNDLRVENCIFADGESPLKESNNIFVKDSSFQWKYPFCYAVVIFLI